MHLCPSEEIPQIGHRSVHHSLGAGRAKPLHVERAAITRKTLIATAGRLNCHRNPRRDGSSSSRCTPRARAALAPSRRGERFARLICRGLATPAPMGAAAHMPASRKPLPHNFLIVSGGWRQPGNRDSSLAVRSGVATHRCTQPGTGCASLLRLIAVDRQLVQGDARANRVRLRSTVKMAVRCHKVLSSQ